MSHAEPSKDSYVRRQVRAAVLELLAERDLSTVTIGAIASRAQVSRVSFYRNYRSKEDVIREHMGILFADWTRRFDQAGGGSEDEFLGQLFAHLSEHSNFYHLLSERGQFHLLRAFLREVCGPKPEYPNLGAYVAAFFAYGLYGWIEEWFARGMPETAQEMVVLLQNRNTAT